MNAKIPTSMSKNLDDSCEAPDDLSEADAQRFAVQLRAALVGASEALHQHDFRLIRPVATTTWAAGTRGHYHAAPELFVQISGWTEFSFPGSRCRLEAGQVLLLPPHLLHAERVGPDGGEPFSNLVLYVDGANLSVHLARERRAGAPGVAYLESYQGAPSASVAQWLHEASDASVLNRGPQLEPTEAPGVTDAVGQRLEQRRAASLVVAALSRTWQLLGPVGGGRSGSSALVAKTRLWVKNQLGDASLSVQGLAQQAGCTPDHLSQRFRQETGELLIAYIGRLRLERACQLLRHTDLSIKEVAWACGYNRSGYFIQTFRRAHGTTPQVWRLAK